MITHKEFDNQLVLAKVPKIIYSLPDAYTEQSGETSRLVALASE